MRFPSALAALCAVTLTPALRAQPATGDLTPPQVVEAVAAEMERGYVLPEVGRRVAAELRAAVRSGAYRQTPAGEALARRLTEALRTASGDGHLSLEFSATPLPEVDSAAAAEMERRDRDRFYGPQINFGFRRAEILDGNVGYLDLRVFAPIDLAGATATAVMTFLAHADVLVVDLRRNGGGHGETVRWLISYLVDGTPLPLSGQYSRRPDETTPSWTLPYVPGSRFGAARPLFVLTSRRTFSAAEAFAYDLQALGRATIVGETTGGGAHPYENVRLSPHYVLGLPTSRSVNPITGGNWQGTGVVPDVSVAADSALAVALRLAERRARPHGAATSGSGER
jgi:hypothetical protein